MTNDDYMRQWNGTPWPEMIQGLPEADIPFPGVRGWLEQSASHQTVYFDIQQGMEVPPHSHGAQWGIMVEGMMTLTIAGVPRQINKGDWYFIPAGAVHSATFAVRSQVIDVFEDAGRYKVKKRE